ncbi:MAG: Zn-ribbon domain-containing OB-fold protein [Desulfobacteraceae bacterium]|nr:MAG: Zn-ribbon domain-containing OB-fold protein [Desulfobacteraceae bacterium]
MKYKIDFQTYSDALKTNRLLGLKCTSCGAVTCPPKMVCQECAGTEQETIELSGKGEIKTFTTTYIASLGRQVEVPYTVIMVALEEGPWISGNLNEMDPKKVTMDIIGRKVTLGHKVFPGDLYSSNEAARPVFSFC